MTINTKFKEGDKIFFLNENKVIETKIQGFRIERLPKSKKDDYETTITYLCNLKEGEVVHIKVTEDRAFKSKVELIESL